MKAVILAGGKGTRLAPYTRIFPKPMMPIGDKTILEVLLTQLKYSGVNHVIITVGHMAGLMRAFFQDGSQYGLDISFSLEQQPLGTAGPLSLLFGLDEPFFVTNGDVLTTLDFNQLMAFHKAQGDAIATIATHQRTVHIDLGVIESDETDSIVDYIEKPDIDYQVSMGVYVFDPKILKYIPKGEYMDFPDLVCKLLEDGQRVANYKFDGYYQDLGRPEDYDQACQDFETLREQFLLED
jgi:NDP-sugar pyrophosphorylase family protein